MGTQRRACTRRRGNGACYITDSTLCTYAAIDQAYLDNSTDNMSTSRSARSYVQTQLNNIKLQTHEELAHGGQVPLRHTQAYSHDTCTNSGRTVQGA